MMLEQFDESVKTFERLLEIEPNNQDYQNEMEKAKKYAQVSLKKEAKLGKALFGR